MLVLTAALLAGAHLGARAQPEPHFRDPSGAHEIRAGRDWLSPSERDFLAGLPEVRVALSRAAGPPYETLSDSGEVHGIQAEMLTSLARLLGLKLRPVVFATWPEVLSAVREGRADIVLTLAITPERLKYLAFTLGTVPVPYGVFARASTHTPLERAHFALEEGFATVETIRRRFPDARITQLPGTAQALQNVAAGQADYYVGPVLEVLAALDRGAFAGLEMREMMQVGSGHYHFGIRKDWAPLAAILNRGITGLRGTPPRALTDALAGVAPGASWPQALLLSDAEQRALQRYPIWRVGAVRGLALLNDINAQGVHSGIASDYVEQVAARLGVGIEVIGFDNVAAMLDGLRGGRIDVVPFLTLTPERAREFSYSQPYLEMPYALLGRVDGPLYWDLGSLRGHRLALALSHPLRPIVAERYPQINVVDAANGNAAIDMVLDGRADAAVEVKAFANYRINDDTGLRLRLLSRVEELPAQFHFAARPEAAGLMPLVDRVLETLPTAERERMLRRWVAVDLQPPFPWRRWLPLLLVSAGALLALGGATAWWMRRLAHEARARRRVVEQLEDIGRALPAVTFRYLLDDEQRMRDIYYSPAADVFFGIELRPDMPLLEQLSDRIAPADMKRWREEERRALATLQPSRLSGTYRHPDGRELRLRVEVVHSRVVGGLHAWTGVITDVSAEHALQRRLDEEAQQRHVLLASASHELRAPTHTLSLALQALPENALSGESARKVRIARDAARTLALLLDDVLDAARVYAGRIELRPQNFDLHALLESLADAHAAAAAAQGLAFRLVVAEDVPRLLGTDPLRLKQVLTNLLSNALKYTERGHVELDCARATIGFDAWAVRFTVSDTGVGIAPEKTQRLFEPFASADPAAGARSTGLGLSVCRRLVDLMGGKIEIDSQLGRGTRATVLLPLAQPPSALDGAPRRDGTLLVCDDDPVSRMLLAELLRAQGHRVREAGDAAEALAAWRDSDVQLVITDLNMPHEGGAELIAALRAEEATRPGVVRMPVIVCSGDPAPAQGGAAPVWDAFISKPVDLRILIDTLSELGLARQA